MIFGRDHLVEMFVDFSADISPPLSIGYKPKIELPGSPAEDDSEHGARGKVQHIEINILSMTGVSLLE